MFYSFIMSFSFDEIPAAVYDSFIWEEFGQQAMIERPEFYNFVCPNCGDMKFPNKKKAYIYKDKWLYKCYKCGTSIPFALHLKQNSPDAYGRLVFSAFGNDHGPRKADKPKPEPSNPPTLPFEEGELVSITSNHPSAKEGLALCKRRMIREEVYGYWFVCQSGDQFLKRDDSGNIIVDPVTGRPLGNEYRDRIIIPFYRFGGSWNQFDARAIDPNKEPRYRNFSGVKRTAYNIDFVKYDRPFYILEGTIDSTFIRNSIAIGGISHLAEVIADNPEIMAHASNCVMLWDNDEPGNKARWETCQAGYKWFDWAGISSKDINGAVMNGEIPLDEDGFVDHSFIESRIRSPGGSGILFMMRYGNMEKRDYETRRDNMRNARDRIAKMKDPEVLF